MAFNVEVCYLPHGGPPGAKAAPASSSIWFRFVEDDGSRGAWVKSAYRSVCDFRNHLRMRGVGSIKEVKI